MPGTRTKSVSEMAWMLAVEMWPDALSASSDANAVTASRRPEKETNRNIRLARIEAFLKCGEESELFPIEHTTQVDIRMSTQESDVQEFS